MLRWSSCCAASAADRSMPADHRGRKDLDQDYGPNDEWYDPVTGLPRPRSFLEHLESELGTPGRPSQSTVMLLLKVPDFRVLRAEVGAGCIDELLRTIAERLHEEVPEPNLVTRLRDGEFAILLRGLGSEVTPEALATRLLERASEPCPIGDRILTCAVVGALAVAGERAETAMQLFDRATRALARAQLHLAGQVRWDPRLD